MLYRTQSCHTSHQLQLGIETFGDAHVREADLSYEL